jgi:hypothetical protein
MPTPWHRVVEEALVHVDPYGVRPLHVSFDIDACDPSFAPATGTPVKGAFRAFSIHFSSHSLSSIWQAACHIEKLTSFSNAFPVRPSSSAPACASSSLQPLAGSLGWTWSR